MAVMRYPHHLERVWHRGPHRNKSNAIEKEYTYFNKCGINIHRPFPDDDKKVTQRESIHTQK